MALNQVFIASDNAFQLNILISWIVESLKCRKHILKFPIWIGYIVCYFLYVIELFTNKKFSFSLRRLKAMNRDVIYSNRKILYALNVANKYGVQQGIKNTIDWYQKRGAKPIFVGHPLGDGLHALGEEESELPQELIQNPSEIYKN